MDDVPFVPILRATARQKQVGTGHHRLCVHCAEPTRQNRIYTAAKAAQENLVLNLAAELKENGVTANIIQVRAIDVENKGTGTTPEEIVTAVLYLFSEEASKVNGARIPLY
jgi:NAD(P)-dependent dehydrogenase (short-subunit alcohol dehydrogenase family)